MAVACCRVGALSVAVLAWDLLKEVAINFITSTKGISGLNGLEWVNLIQMTIISATVGKNPLEEIEKPFIVNKESEMQYLGAVSKTTV